MSTLAENRPAIRDARPDERAAIQELTLAAYAEYAQVMAPQAWAGLRNAVLTGLNGEPDAARIVAELDGALVGSVLLCPPTIGAYGGAVARIDWPEIRLLAVAPSARGHGVGRALILECEQRGRASGARAIGLHTSRSLKIAIHLYEQLGYTRVPEYDFQPPGAEVVTAYRKEL